MTCLSTTSGLRSLDDATTRETLLFTITAQEESTCATNGSSLFKPFSMIWAFAHPGIDDRTSRQHQKLLERKLLLGDTRRARKQSTWQCARYSQRRTRNDRYASRQRVWSESEHHMDPDQSQPIRQASVYNDWS